MKAERMTRRNEKGIIARVTDTGASVSDSSLSSRSERPIQAGTSVGVTLDTDAELAVITIDRPDVRNAIGFATVSELDRALDDVLATDAAVLVIRGGGDRAFVSGGDLKELAAVRTHDDAVAMARTVRHLLDRIASFPVPVIAALNGHALGGGAEVAIAADIRIAADDVKIGFNQVTLGIMPAWGGAERLAQVIGRGRAMLAIATGELYDAPTAHALGLVDVVVPRAAFEPEWRALARRLADTVPGATRAIKTVLGAAVRTHRPDLEAAATDEFARLWTAEAHWAAVDALERKRRSS
jgi:enoyl-CoA hydratase/carnithine racemase